MSCLPAILLLSCFFAGCSILPFASAQRDIYFRWTSDGSGIRSNCMHMGYVNVMHRAGLIGATADDTVFGSMSFTSAGLWFAAQFFWSEQFFNGTALEESIDALYDFSYTWGTAYVGIWNPLKDLFQRGKDSLLAEAIKQHEVSLNLALTNLLEIASTNYGDPGLLERPASYDNRVPGLSKTDLYLANALHPNVRHKGGFGKFQDSITYLGPSSNLDVVYAIPFAYQLAYKEDRVFWYPGVDDQDLPLRTCSSRKVPLFFHFDDWRDFNLYPENAVNGSSFVDKSRIPPCEVEGYLTEPLGGGIPTVQQAAFTGSSTGIEFSSRGPSSFAQHISTILDNFGIRYLHPPLNWVAEKTFMLGVQALWKLFDNKVNLGLCTQTDDECVFLDGLFSHTPVIDAASLPMTIGQHHSIDNGDLGRTLKLIHTVHTLNNKGSFLQFFNTTSNIGVPPGGYHWPPLAAGGPATTPYPSHQVFDYYLDQEMFDSMLTQINGTYVKYVRFPPLTTVANPSVHVKAGQTVDLLVMRINDELPLSDVPFILNYDPVDFAECTRSTAASEELLQIIKDFAES